MNVKEQEILSRLFGGKTLNIFTAEEIKQILEACEALWLYPGEPSPEFPHALLTSGLHSDGFVNVGAMLKEYPTIRRIMAQSLLFTLRQVWQGRIGWVVGADTSSTDLAYEVAMLLPIDTVRHVRMVKTEDERGKRQVWSLDNKPLRQVEVGLHIEELITTSSSAIQVRQGIRQANPKIRVEFAPYVPVIVDRSPPDRWIEIEGSPVLSLLRLEIKNFDPGSCPYCAAGSVAIKPKEGDNWFRLTQARK